MNNPTHYSDICQKAFYVQEKYSLTDVQTLLYNHICRGDFKLRNSDGQKFYDRDHNGFGWSGDRRWVKKQLRHLIAVKLINFISLRDCRSMQYTSWYFWDPGYNFGDLIDASCYVSTHKLALIKHYLNLPDGFDKNKKYGDIKFIKEKIAGFSNYRYTFRYKGEGSIYAWDLNSKGIKQDLTWWSCPPRGWLTDKKTYDKPLYYESFHRMIHDIWSFLAHEGFKYTDVIPGYHT